jgi:hypothetical protein
MGRPALPPKEKARRNKEQRQKRLAEQHKRLEAGLCRQCGEPRSDKSQVFCDKHLARHRETCRGYASNEDPNTAKYRRLKSSAQQRSITVDFDKEEFMAWFEGEQKQCHYCGIEEHRLHQHHDPKQRRLTVDRKDSKRHYCVNNICLACFRCNNMKSNFFTSEEWMGIALNIIRPRLAEYHNLGE